MEELKVNKEVNRTEVESLAQESKKVIKLWFIITRRKRCNRRI